MIPVNEPLLDGNEKKYLCECIETGWISSEGPFVRRLEEGMAARCGRKHAVAVANGSVALDAAVVALGLGPGDKVILPTFTIISCAAAVVRAGATPLVVDADPVTWNMDLNQVEGILAHAARRGDRSIKAVMAVHIYGLPVDMQALIALADKYGIRVIEDAAEMHGQTCRGKPCGGFGDISTFSFYPNKHVTTGEGGMILCDDDSLAERCRNLRNLFFDKERRYIHEELGWNLRMSNLQAAVGCAQLERLDEFIARKRRMGARYSELLADLPGLQLPLPRTNYAESIYWVYGVVLEDEVGFDAAEAIARLRRLGIGCRHFFYPMHSQPAFRRRGLFEGVHLPVAERLAQRGFYLPSGLALTDSQIETVAAAVREVLQ